MFQFHRGFFKRPEVIAHFASPCDRPWTAEYLPRLLMTPSSLEDGVSGNAGAVQINVDFPAWVVEKLDREATRLGVPRQSLIKVWIAERLKEVD